MVFVSLLLRSRSTSEQETIAADSIRLCVEQFANGASHNMGLLQVVLPCFFIKKHFVDVLEGITSRHFLFIAIPLAFFAWSGGVNFQVCWFLHVFGSTAYKMLRYTVGTGCDAHAES